MNSDIEKLQSYPFEKLQQLFSQGSAPQNYKPMALSIGEPKHPCPQFIQQALVQHVSEVERYPLTKGSEALRQTLSRWFQTRYRLQLDPEQNIIPVNGTREALFAFAQAAVDRNKKRYVLMPNPFYQIYEGACLLAGAQPYFLNTTEDNGFLPDLDGISPEIWKQSHMIYVCNPGNPSGAVMGTNQLRNLIELANRYNFVIASDECYSEIYFDETAPPPGLLQVAREMGNDNFRNCIVFNSLSKRSNAPGLRSGFVAGDAEIIKKFLLYRTYHGNAMSLPIQAASIAAWQDEEHVKENRRLYRKKFEMVHGGLSGIWDLQIPPGGFYLWPKTPVPDEQFALDLFSQYNVRILPGSYLGRESQGFNPGKNHVRIALVGDLDETGRLIDYLIEYFKKK